MRTIQTQNYDVLEFMLYLNYIINTCYCVYDSCIQDTLTSRACTWPSGCSSSLRPSARTNKGILHTNTIATGIKDGRDRKNIIVTTLDMISDHHQ